MSGMFGDVGTYGSEEQTLHDAVTQNDTETEQDEVAAFDEADDRHRQDDS